MTLPPDDGDFDSLDPENENSASKPLRRSQSESWMPEIRRSGSGLMGRKGELPSTSTSGPSFTGAPVMFSRIILLAVIAIISVAAYFAGSGAFKPYSAKLFDLFSQRTASAPSVTPQRRNLGSSNGKPIPTNCPRRTSSAVLAGNACRRDADINPGCNG